jgi:hypothetical protein
MDATDQDITGEVDLNERPYNATRLLVTTGGWRQRVVEQVRPISPDHYEIRRTFQLEMPPEVFDGMPEDTTLPIVVPVCWLPKRPLLEFDLTDAHGTPKAVLPRIQNAGVVGRILFDQQVAHLSTTYFDTPLLVAAAAASVDAWNQQVDAGSRPADDVLIDYVEQGTGTRIRPSDASRLLEEGRRLTAAAYEVSGLSAWWPPSDKDNPALSGALLVAYADPTVTDRTGLVEWVDHYNARIESVVTEAAGSPEARTWLRMLALAGVRWAVMTTQTCSAGEVFLMKMTEVRPSGHPRVRRFVHDADLAGADSYHLRIHSPDPSVVIRSVVARGGPDAVIGFPNTFETTRQTDVLFTAYSMNDDRPDRATFEINLGLRGHVWSSYAMATLIALVAALAVYSVDRLAADMAAVLAIPVSLVSAFVVVRESTITARYLNWPRRVLIGVSLVVWMVVIWRVLEWPWIGGS